MKTNRKKYTLTQEALESAEKHLIPNGRLNLGKNSKKSNALVAINPSTGELHYIVPYFFNGNYYGAHFPNPVELYYKQAIEHEKLVNSAVKSFEDNIDFVFEQRPPSDFSLKMVNSEIYDLFLVHKISCLTALISTVEAFANEQIPEDFRATDRRNRELGKFEIERYWDIKSKLKNIIPELVPLNLKEYNRMVDAFLEMNTLRNEFVHLKFKTDPSNIDPYLEIFKKLVALDLEEELSKVKALINFIKPAYL